MREAEIAALSDEFFEPSFDQSSATVMLGTVVSTDDLGDRRITYLRPDARSLAQAEVHVVRDPAGSGELLVEDVVLTLRGSRMYSRSTLEGMFGEGRKLPGPASQEGDASQQLEFELERTLKGTVALRWWTQPDDPATMGDANGPDELRADEIVFHRALVDELVADDDVEPEVTEAGGPPRTMPPVSMPPPVEVDLDEAMDTGAWVADFVWRILRHDFTLPRAREVFGEPAEATGTVGGERVVLKPHDPRLEIVTVTTEHDTVTEVRVEVQRGAPLVVAVDAISDRLNAQPIAQPGEITFQFESTRSRGSVSLIVASSKVPAGPIAVVNVIEVGRG